MRLAAPLAAIAVTLVVTPAAAVEDRVHLGATAGLATATFPTVTVAGFNGALHALYGVTDAVNLRASVDVSMYDLPDPDSSALMWGGLVGGEYVLDTLDWVVYGGAQAGPVLVSVQAGSDTWQAGVEIPVGLRYLLSDRFALHIVEARIRFQFFGDETSPLDQLMLTTGLELML